MLGVMVLLQESVVAFFVLARLPGIHVLDTVRILPEQVEVLDVQEQRHALIRTLGRRATPRRTFPEVRDVLDVRVFVRLITP